MMPPPARLARRRERRLILVLVLNLVIVAGEAAAGILAGSLGLLADAGHNLTDVVGVGAALLAVIWMRRPPNEQRSYGNYRGSVLAAQANAAIILATTALILYEGVRRLLEPPSVDGGIVLVVGTAALLGNGISALLLWEREEDVNMRAALLHMAADAGASAGVVVGGAVILVTGRFAGIDPAISIGIGLLIGWQAWKMLRMTGEMLLESTPRGLDLRELADAIRATSGVDDVHDLHVWSLSSEVRALSGHLILSGHPSLEEAQEVGTRVKGMISGPFRIAHATFELECEGCIDDGSWCAIVQVDLASPPAAHTHG
jgi:cobalt-zinc-cadmium efflux system protein